MKRLIDKYSVFIFDLDGTIYRGNKIIPGADETINYLKQLGMKTLFISNKTTGGVKDYYSFLKKWNVNIELDEIITSTIVLKKYLSKNYSSSKFFAIGEKVFINEIKNAGINFSENPEEIDLLLVTLDRTLNFKKLEIAAKALEKGAKFYAANIDDTCPVDSGEVIDAGSTISALEKRTHLKLEKHFGKPSEFMMNEIKSRFNFNNNEAIIIGDRIETDIALGNIFGIDTALVSTGIKNHLNGKSKNKPTFKLNSVYNLIKD